MNGIIESICHHIRKGRRIVGIEAYGPRNIVIYLADGSEHQHSSGASGYQQFNQRVSDAEKMFPDIPWHREPHDAIPDWLTDLQAKRTPANNFRLMH
jgi:hypothetical protein